MKRWVTDGFASPRLANQNVSLRLPGTIPNPAGAFSRNVRLRFRGLIMRSFRMLAKLLLLMLSSAYAKSW